MGQDETAIVERLIAYWRGREAADGPSSEPSCRQLVAELAPSMSAVELLALQQDPEGHREEIECRVAAWLATRPPSRDILAAAAAPAPPPVVAPPPAAAAPLQDPAPDAGQGSPPRGPAASPGPGSPAPSPPAERDQPAGGLIGRLEQRVQAEQGNVILTLGGIQSHAGGVHLNLPGAWGGAQAPPRESAGAARAASSVRILFLGANPADSTRLRLGEEVREIERGLAAAELGSRCELNQKWAVRVSDLQGYLLRTKPQIVHFSGHGSRESAVVLESDDGGSRPVAAALLARLLAQFKDRLRCVVLNACFSAGQAEAIAEQIDCVVGMSAAVLDRAAIRFAAAFYLALASGCSVRAAFDQACADIEVGELRQDQVPQLLARRCDPAEVVLVRANPS